MRSKELRAQRAKIVTEAQALISKDGLTVEENAQFDAMMLQAENLLAQIDRMERADTEAAAIAERDFRNSRNTGRSADEEAEARIAANRAFGNFLRFGMAHLSPEDRTIAQRALSPVRAALAEGTGAAGGYTIPQGFYDQLTDAQKAYGGMLTGGASIIDTETGNTLPMPTSNDTNNVGALLAENTQVTTQDVNFGVMSLGAYTFTSKLVLVSNQLLQDSAFDLGTWLSGKLGTRIARALNNYFTVGTGQAGGQPFGIVPAAVASGATVTGATGETTSLIYDDLVNLEHAVDPAYRQNGKFMFNDAVLKILKKLKDGYGRPLWLSGIGVKEPDTINGYPYLINQSMPVPAANAVSMVFGDMSSYMIRRVAGTQLLRMTERYADYNQTGFLAFQRWDGTLLDAGTHPVAAFQQSAT